MPAGPPPAIAGMTAWHDMAEIYAEYAAFL
jgi:hypothetical protein